MSSFRDLPMSKKEHNRNIRWRGADVKVIIPQAASARIGPVHCRGAMRARSWMADPRKRLARCASFSAHWPIARTDGAIVRSEDDLLDLVGRIYDAAIDPALWPGVLTDISDATGSAGINLVIADKHSSKVTTQIPARLSDDGVEDYEKYYCFIDPRIDYYLSNPNVIYVYDYMFTNEDDMNRSEYYSWLSSLGLRYFLAATLLDDDDAIAWASLQRTPREGHVDDEHVRLFEDISRHLRQSVVIAQRFSHRELGSLAAVAALDRLPFAVFVLDEHGRILLSNAMATEMAGSADGFGAGTDGLHAMRPAEDAALQRLIGDAIRTHRGEGLGGGGSLALPRPSGARPYQLTASPLPRREALFALRNPAAVVFVSDPDAAPELPEQTLRRLYGLGKREAALAALLAAGLTLERAAEHLGVTRATARNMLRSVFRKTGTHRQAELIALLLRSPAAIVPGAGGVN